MYEFDYFNKPNKLQDKQLFLIWNSCIKTRNLNWTVKQFYANVFLVLLRQSIVFICKRLCHGICKHVLQDDTEKQKQ